MVYQMYRMWNTNANSDEKDGRGRLEQKKGVNTKIPTVTSDTDQYDNTPFVIRMVSTAVWEIDKRYREKR